MRAQHRYSRNLATAAELLSNASWVSYRKLSTPVASLAITAKSRRLARQAHGEDTFYDVTRDRPTEIRLPMESAARIVGATTAAPDRFPAPLDAADSSLNAAEQGFTYKLNGIGGCGC